MKFCAKILEYIKMGIKANLAYTAFTWASIAANLVQITVFYFIWISIYGDKTYINGISKTQIVTYIILSRIIYSQVSFGSNLYIADRVQSGEIAIDMLVPLNFRLLNYVIRMGDFIFYIFSQAIPAVFISFVFFGLSGPVSIYAGIVFVLSLVMSVTMAFFIELILGMMAFYTSSGWGLQQIKVAIMGFFSGALVPVAFFPDWLKEIVNVLPFKDLVYTPIAVYLGILQEKALVSQLIWTIILFLISGAFYRLAIRKLTVQGG
jgi:ABC-2 type transport system permease protein